MRGVDAMMSYDTWKQLAATASVKLVQDGMVVGLGTGSTAAFMIHALAQRIQEGLRIVGAVASSQASQDLAAQLSIPLTDLETHPELDLYIDGTDEIDPQLRLLKGGGGALLREKILATSSKRFIVIADSSKRVAQLGQNFAVPVETVPFALTPVRKRLESLEAVVSVRKRGDSTFITENGNIILDCVFPNAVANPEDMDARMQSIVGVIETGFFLHLAQQAFIGGPDGVTVLA
ncbi:MAG: ribose-5-phosphate isomerase RpiA [Chloroflexi bacterium]|nr:ribose-5-phosphate isomerase RpiA [Ktedonobacteraceae bacterium]MBV9707265.1 ribose-5-phosphate isomerase RpiA [Chloroflexota bacterium]